MSWLNTTVKQELVTPAMLSFLYSKVLQLYRHNHKKKNYKNQKLRMVRKSHCLIYYMKDKTTAVKRSCISWGNTQL